MDNDAKDEALIDKYLTGQLTEREQQRFTERQADPAFVEQLTFLQDLSTAATKAGKLAFKQRLQDIEKERQPIQKPRLAFRQKLAIAAGFLLLFAVSALWYAQANFSNRAIYAQQYSAPNFSTIRSETSTETSSAAVRAFYTQNYDQAIILLEAQDSLRGDSLLLAHAYLQSGQPTRALTLLPNSAKARRLPEEWQWVEVLALLSDGQQEALENKLEIISTNASPAYQKKAQAMLQKLQSPWRRFAQ